jgi:hypothetical protein
MIINIKDTLTLDDNNEYVVISKINYESKNYYYLLDKNNKENFKFCYEDKEELVEVDDKQLATKLLPLFVEAAKKEINS